MTNKPIRGTFEWAVANVNCCTGCSHDCRYCYARHNAIDRFHKVQAGQWTTMKPLNEVPARARRHYDGTVMFPTTHDITPEIYSICGRTLNALLTAGNTVLVVSKPHLIVVQAMCRDFADYKGKILFRFTIGCDDSTILSYWEPGAPDFDERFASLCCAYTEGFQTSVSVEPMLDSPNIVRHVQRMQDFVTDAIWIGKLNHINQRVKVETDEDRMQVQRICDGQTDTRIREIYESLKDNPKVKWKESVKEVVGLPLPQQPGEDM